MWPPPSLHSTPTYFYPRSPRGERPLAFELVHVDAVISIHAPREGSDGARAQGHRLNLSISIHAPREGSDPASPGCPRWRGHFYPRSPRGERRPPGCPPAMWTHFYPRSPRGERQSPPFWSWPVSVFLSTLPARGATASWMSTCVVVIFQSTLPARGATVTAFLVLAGIRISIHAPREGSDGMMYILPPYPMIFLSTLPARGATFSAQTAAALPQFLSTLPARGATKASATFTVVSTISIHAPREGSDGGGRPNVVVDGDFYPRSPRGERLVSMLMRMSSWSYFYPRSPRGERPGRGGTSWGARR